LAERYRKWIAFVLRWLAALRREYSEGGLDHRAMSLVYTSLLALAPLLAVSFSVLKSFGVHNQLEPFLLEFLAPLGEKAPEVTATIIGFVESISVGVLGVVGFATLFYTVVSLIGKIEDNFNHIWRVSKARSFARRFSDYLSVILVGPVLVFSAFGIMASTANAGWVRSLIAIQPFGLLYYAVSVALPYLFIIAAFTFVYVFIPNARVRWTAAFTGGALAGLTWKLVGSLFASFVADSASYSAIYSSFAAVILFMLWLYISWLILLLGGAISFHVQYPRYLNYASRRPRLSVRCLEELGLGLMYLIGLRHYRGEASLTLHDLADAVNLPWESVADTLAVLESRRLLVVTNGNSRSYQLARDTDAIRLHEIVVAVRAAGDVDALPLTGLPRENSTLTRLEGSLDQAATTALDDLTLRDILSDQQPPFWHQSERSRGLESGEKASIPRVVRT
jgi:membrane protein